MLQQLMEANREIDRLVAHWKEEGKDMSKKQLRAAVAHDLEMLEYSPAQVAAIVPQICDRVCGD